MRCFSFYLGAGLPTFLGFLIDGRLGDATLLLAAPLNVSIVGLVAKVPTEKYKKNVLASLESFLKVNPTPYYVPSITANKKIN